MFFYYALVRLVSLIVPIDIFKVSQVRYPIHYSKEVWEFHFQVETNTNKEHYPLRPY